MGAFTVLFLTNLSAAQAICLGLSEDRIKTKQCQEWATQCMIEKTIQYEGDRDGAFEECAENIPAIFIEDKKEEK